MKEQLIEFETAKLAKEKGFKITCVWAYSEREAHITEDLPTRGGTRKHEYIPPRLVNWEGHIRSRHFGQADHERFIAYAPTQSLLQKWLREEHDIHVWLQHKVGRYQRWIGKYCYYPDEGLEYEEALEKGLIKALKLIE